MIPVYILLEERESSELCSIHGVWNDKKEACKEMIKHIEENELYTEKSKVDYDEGTAESDPEYCDDEYSNYSVIQFNL